MDLFDIIEKQEAEEKPKECKHHHEDKTETQWPGDPVGDLRWTWTCVACGRIRGRCVG